MTRMERRRCCAGVSDFEPHYLQFLLQIFSCLLPPLRPHHLPSLVVLILFSLQALFTLLATTTRVLVHFVRHLPSRSDISSHIIHLSYFIKAICLVDFNFKSSFNWLSTPYQKIPYFPRYTVYWFSLVSLESDKTNLTAISPRSVRARISILTC